VTIQHAATGTKAVWDSGVWPFVAAACVEQTIAQSRECFYIQDSLAASCSVNGMCVPETTASGLTRGGAAWDESGAGDAGGADFVVQPPDTSIKLPATMTGEIGGQSVDGAATGSLMDVGNGLLQLQVTASGMPSTFVLLSGFDVALLNTPGVHTVVRPDQLGTITGQACNYDTASYDAPLTEVVVTVPPSRGSPPSPAPATPVGASDVDAGSPDSGAVDEPTAAAGADSGDTDEPAADAGGDEDGGDDGGDEDGDEGDEVIVDLVGPGTSVTATVGWPRP
jgi:hypothetical protein